MDPETFFFRPSSITVQCRTANVWKKTSMENNHKLRPTVTDCDTKECTDLTGQCCCICFLLAVSCVDSVDVHGDEALKEPSTPLLNAILQLLMLEDVWKAVTFSSQNTFVQSQLVLLPPAPFCRFEQQLL